MSRKKERTTIIKCSDSVQGTPRFRLHEAPVSSRLLRLQNAVLLRVSQCPPIYYLASNFYTEKHYRFLIIPVSPVKSSHQKTHYLPWQFILYGKPR